MSAKILILFSLAVQLAFTGTAGADTSPAEHRIAVLEREFEAAVERFMEDYAAASEAEREALLADPAREPRQRFTPMFLQASRAERGRPAALAGWIWLAEHGTIADAAAGEEAVARILADHPTSPELAPAAKAIRRAGGIRGRDRTLSDLDAIVAASPHPKVRAATLLQRGLLLRRSDDETDLAAAREALEAAARLSPNADTLEEISAALAELGALAAGTPAPTLAGVTLDGKEIGAADLAGRVLLVEFWGMWCGPCISKLPELTRLHARYRDRGFTVLGVNSDAEPGPVRSFLAREGVDWPSLVDGSTEGPLATAWRVRSWPTAYVVDREGRIRGRDLSGDELRELLERLLVAKD